MDGTVIGKVKYRDGHSDLGLQAISGQIIALPSNLTFQNSEGVGLISVPWENFSNAHQGVLHKEGLAGAGAMLMKSIPGLDIFASSYYVGLWLAYWDNDIRRNQDVFFDTVFEPTAEKMVRRIIQCRDQYYRQTKNASSPQRRY